MPTPNITLDGRLIADAEVNFTASGKGVCNMRVACNDPKKDDGSYGDGLIANVAVWNSQYEPQAAENCAEMTKGDRVVVTGRLYQREYEHNGEKRTSLEVKFARVSRPIDGGQRQQSQGAGGGSWGGGQQAPAWHGSGDDSAPPF